MKKEKALEILDVFYGQPTRFCSLHLEGKAVKALGGIKKALPYIRKIVEKNDADLCGRIEKEIL